MDIAPGMLEAAESLATGLDPRCVFRRGAAEALPFPHESFDGVLSTYGVIVSTAPTRAVAEMARVRRPGGRLALATWADDPEGYIAGVFGLVGEWPDASPPPASPFDWGRPDWLQEMLGAFFEIEAREQVTTLYAPDVATVWEENVRGFGPVAATHAARQPDRREAFRAAFEDFHRPYATASGLTIPRLALVVRGVRL